MATIAAKLGMSRQLDPPESDERTESWLGLFGAAARGRPYTNGYPLPLPPLDVLSLMDRLMFPAGVEEALEVVSAMDHEWLEWAENKR
ncbi:hypothetical protein KZO85_09875 [Chromohalobacter canadensis]|uniref:hypothetical protein n=1 Tax=Chromohalobacter canadensis TaxID=141389 RepID=UPI0021BFC796|nr:hypothetical protein [Chromohalobacter canadensis]MCT8468888.1 hypothetical protein [Chromohalobacter canadensis]MCT8472922.1 hypothetical protein [Chromohalobacter canadensis]MCT8500374.1 hypothetical protein [Chromohalobacter canadensis]